MNNKKLTTAISAFIAKKKTNAAYYEENWTERKERKSFYPVSYTHLMWKNTISPARMGNRFGTMRFDIYTVRKYIPNRIVPKRFPIRAGDIVFFHISMNFFNGFSIISHLENQLYLLRL